MFILPGLNYALIVTADYIGLQNLAEKKINPFIIDFTRGKLRHRQHKAGLRNELLARALGGKPKDNAVIVDVTAGLGRDAFILASLGFYVTLIERSPILHGLLQDALRRAASDNAISRMQLIHADAMTWLREHQQHIDIIYLDPMFPPRQKSAKVKKEARILQDIIGKENDSDTLFQLSLSRAAKRVVVKRPRLAPALNGPGPSFSLEGSSSRFDIYLV